MDRDICQLEQHFTPALLLLSSLLMPGLLGRVHRAQDKTAKLILTQRPLLPLTLQCVHHLRHGAHTSGDVVIDLRQKSPPRPHRCQLLIEQDDVVVPVDLHPAQQELRTG